MPRVAIIGAGLAGSLLAIYLAKRGIEVDVYEARGDMRLEEVAGGRSINLALSDRGIAALRDVGMDEYMLADAVPMYGRMIHPTSDETKLLPYSGRKGEYINSISRSGLNIALMNEAEKHAGVRFHFHKRCVEFDCANGEAKFTDGSVTDADTVIATDGAGSVVRQAMETQVADFRSSTVFLEHGYKELHIPPGDDGAFLLEKNALHIWPRHQFMMIALPNWDGSFTCTLFLAHLSEPAASAACQLDQRGVKVRSVAGATNWPPAHAGGSDRAAFSALTDEDCVREFFEREFSDAVPLMPTLLEDFFANPTGDLATLKCWPWNVGGKALLLGDAAHAVVPFYGQGMNCAFEDVRLLATSIDEQVPEPPASAGGQIVWNDVFEKYSRLRKPNTDAIADMAEDNFYEMRDRVADPVFQRKRELETRLEQTYADYFSKYSMVTFREDMPYSEAMRRGNAQDAFLMEFCRNLDDVSAVDLDAVQKEMRKVVQ
jgi:kynurenine 3-monooxygenase